jgi:nitrite reductase (NO-forming)
MKNLKLVAIATLTTATFLFSCGGDEKKETPTTTEAPKSMLEETPAAGGLDAKIASGKAVYEKVCQACHQADGKGLPATFPPLAGSDYLAADLPRAIGGVVNGLTGEITVNGEKFNQAMPAATLTDEEVAAAFTFVLNNFGNKGGEVNAADVKAVRK